MRPSVRHTIRVPIVLLAVLLSAPTATVMIDFHRHLIRENDPAESLRQAELALARDPRYRHPFYWAAFVVMGAP